MTEAAVQAQTIEQQLEVFGLEREDARVREVSDEWVMQLMESGLLVRVHIGGWRGQKKLKPEDLGLAAPEDEKRQKLFHELMHLGVRYLMPAKMRRKLSSLETRGRQNLDEHGISVGGDILRGQFVPASAWDSFVERHEELKAEYEGVYEDFLAGLDEEREKIAAAYRQLARSAYRRERGLTRNAPLDEEDFEEYAEEYVARIMAAYPSPEEIRERIRFEFVPTMIPLPSRLAADYAEAERERAKAEKERAQAYAEAEQIRSAADAQRRMKLEAAGYWQKRQRELIDGFLADVVAELRGRVYDVVTDAVDSIERNDYLHNKTKLSLENLIDAVRRLDVYGDTDLETALGRLEEQLRLDSKDRDVSEIHDQLDALATVTRASLVSLRTPARGGADLDEAENVPTEFEVKRARKRLGLGDVAPAAVEAAVQRAGKRQL